MTQDEVRVRALSVAVITYTIISTLFTEDLIKKWIPASSTDPKILNFVLIIARTLTLGVILAGAIRILRWIWARRILGRWAYKSSKGNFGLADIRFVHGSLKYSVQLFYNYQEVLDVWENAKPVSAFAIVKSEMCKYESDSGVFQTDYHIESVSETYKSRKGLLTLTPTGPGQMKGQWYSTVEGFDSRAGDLIFLRKKEFKKLFTEQHGAEHSGG
jgi:hypothetical protein